MQIRAAIISFILGRLRLLTYKIGLSAPVVAFIPPDRLLVRTVHGFSLYCLCRDMSLTPSIVSWGCWEPAVERAFLRAIERPDSVVIEVGANIGYHTVLGSRKAPAGQYYAFEPNPGVRDVLKSNLVLNQAHHVIVESAPVLDSTREVEFSVLARHCGAASVLKFEAWYLDRFADEATVLKLRSTSLDERFAELPRADVLKIDAEGSEPLVLRGAKELIRRSDSLKIIFEFNGPMIANLVEPQDMLSEIEAAGFKLYEIVAQGEPVARRRQEFERLKFYEILAAR